MGLFSRTQLSERSERAAQKTLANIRAQRRSRFRILACIDGSDESFDTVRFAARLSPHDNCDIVILYVRPIDQGLSTGGLNVKIARQNLLEAGGELPGLKSLKKGLEILEEEGFDTSEWVRETDHEDAWGDPVGDNKVVFKSPAGKSVVLKLKTAPDVAAGILDQYEHGPYNLIILNEPSRWRGVFKSVFDAGIALSVVSHAPCSVMVAREISLKNDGFLIYNDGTARAMQTIRRTAVLAQSVGQPISILAVAEKEKGRKIVREYNKQAKAILESLGIEVRRISTAVGDPATQIIKAGANRQIIIMPDDGGSRLKRIIRGSLAYDVIKGAVTSVMDVR